MAVTLDGVYDRINKVAHRDPEAIALVVDGEEISYETLMERIRSCAGLLQQLGCCAGDRVIILYPNSLDFVVAVFSAWTINAIPVPLNEKFQLWELKQYLQDCSPRVLFHRPGLEAISSLEIQPDSVQILTETIGKVSFEPEKITGDLDAPGLYMFSSGSTGKAKRVTRTQRQVLAEYDALASTLELGPGERVVCTIPLYHAHGFCNAMMAALIGGGRLILLTHEFNARKTVAAIVKHEATLLPTVPFMCLQMANTFYSKPTTLSTLRYCLSAGAPLPLDVGERFYQKFNIPVCQLYGSTETGVISINHNFPLEKPDSVGQPLHGMAIKIMNAEGEICLPNEVGEVWTFGPTITKKYDGLEQLSSECFRDDGFFTGDLGKLDETGNLVLTGRDKLIIIVAGQKVDPREVEFVIMKHPKVAEVVVVGVKHVQSGESIKAVVVSKQGESCTEKEILEFCKTHLAEYKVPKVIEFRPALPRSPLGKILRKYC
ncbi:MAG: acyl--CoA ligase [Magnetococcales bacterium]|nr:acyl--CoA ligase [Magnetococcales bacterium]